MGAAGASCAATGGTRKMLKSSAASGQHLRCNLNEIESRMSHAPPHPSPFVESRLPPEEQTRVLRLVLDRVRERRGGRPPVLVFDLDGTLMDNRPRVVRILHDLAEHWAERFPEAAECCRRATAEAIGYGFHDNLLRLGVHADLHQEGFMFWRERFFTDSILRHDIEVAGAREFVQACYEAGAVCVYLTGRDLPNMALGSFGSLRDLGFPIGVVGTELVVKPTFEMPDPDFKRIVAPGLERVGEVIGVFDNEPANCNLMLEFHPDATTVFLDTQAAPNPPPLDRRVHVIEDFRLHA